MTDRAVPSLHEIVAQLFYDTCWFSDPKYQTTNDCATAILSAIREALSEGALRDARVDKAARAIWPPGFRPFDHVALEDPDDTTAFREVAAAALDAADALLRTERAPEVEKP